MNVNKMPSTFYSLNGNKAEDEKLLEPLTYVVGTSEEEELIRIKLVQAFNYWLNIPDEKVQAITEIINMLCYMNLLVDDIQDNSSLRRGIPTVHSVFGVALTVNAVTYTMFIILDKVVFLHSAGMKIYVEQLLELQRIQGMEIFWKNNLVCPSEADYTDIIKQKDGAIFNLATRLMKLFSSHDKDFSSLTAILALYLQIRDDYCNLCRSKHSVDKTYYENITEGIFSIPVIHALTNNPNDKQIISILKLQTKSIEIKHYYIELLEKFGSLKYTADMLKELDKTARTEIERLGGNPLLEKLLDELTIRDYKESDYESTQARIF